MISDYDVIEDLMVTLRRVTCSSSGYLNVGIEATEVRRTSKVRNFKTAGHNNITNDFSKRNKKN